MTEFLQLLVLGMATGGFYTLNALGMVVVFRSSGIINFASGGVAMVGGYLEYEFADANGLPKIISVIGAVAISATVNLAIYGLAIRPLHRAATLTKVIATLAILVSLQQLIILEFGGVSKVPTSWLPDNSVHVGPLQVGADSLIILGSTIVLTFVLWAAYHRTRFGVATSALAEAPRSLSALGWNVSRLRAANWAIAGALAGLAGTELGPLLQLTPTNFTNLLIPTLAGAMIGGLRSFPMTLVGGLLVGGLQAEAGRYLTWSGSGDAAPFVVILLVLVIRGRAIPLRNFVQERLPRVGSGQVSPARVLIAVGVVAALAFFVQESWVVGAMITLMTSTVLLSQVVITGYAGQLSLAQWTLGGTAAIVAVNISADHHTPFLLSLVIGMIVVIPISLLVGLPSLRARGVSLAVATLGFAVAINAVVLNNDSFTGGLTGLVLQPQTIFGWSIDATLYPRRYFLVVLAVFTVLALAVTNLRRGRVGRRMLAVRNNERAASALGINVMSIKLYAFVIAGMIAAAGGVLLSFYQALPQFSNFDPLSGLTTLIGGILGGIGYVAGALIGGLFSADGLPNAILYPWLGNKSWWNELFPLLTGVVLTLQLIGNPDGVADALVHGRAKVRRLRAFGKGKGKGTDSMSQDAIATSDMTASRDTTAPRNATAGATRSGSAHVEPSPSGLRSTVAGLLYRFGRAARRERVRVGYAREIAAAGQHSRSARGGHLSASGIRVTFGSVVAIDSVDIEVRPAQVLAVIGPNGAGKTTLMDALTGFVPMSGTITLDGTRIEKHTPHRRARLGVARSFQSLELLEDMTVMDNLRCAAEPQDSMSLVLDLVHPARGAITPAMAAAIDAFGLGDKLDKMPTEIGYGDRRLVAIARAVAGEPAVLLLDEPAAGLSEYERREVSRIITMMAHEWGIAVVLIEHDVQLVRQVADHVIALDFGVAIAEGDAESVLHDPEVIRAYLGSPLDEIVPDPPGSAVPAPHADRSRPRRSAQPDPVQHDEVSAAP